MEGEVIPGQSAVNLKALHAGVSLTVWQFDKLVAFDGFEMEPHSNLLP